MCQRPELEIQATHSTVKVIGVLARMRLFLDFPGRWRVKTALRVAPYKSCRPYTSYANRVRTTDHSTMGYCTTTKDREGRVVRATP